jgi:hypothetical protein
MKIFIYLFGFLLFFQTTNINDCKIETSMNELTNSLYNNDDSEDVKELKNLSLKYNKSFSQYLNQLKNEKIFKKRKFVLYVFNNWIGHPYGIGDGYILLNNNNNYFTRFGKVEERGKFTKSKPSRIDSIILNYKNGIKLKPVDSSVIKLLENEKNFFSKYTENEKYKIEIQKKYNDGVSSGKFLNHRKVHLPKLLVVIEKNEIQKIYFIDNTYFGERLVYDINDSEKYEKICDSISKAQ